MRIYYYESIIGISSSFSSATSNLIAALQDALSFLLALSVH